MLRHGCGYALANAGHDTRALQAWLGHKNIQHSALHRAGAGSVQGLLAVTRAMIQKRVRAGLARAKDEGKTGGLR
jgi:integrase